jgi:hypothetical protein
MSVYLCVLWIATFGQAAVDDRYGPVTPFDSATDDAAADSILPPTTTPQQPAAKPTKKNVGPPPPIAGGQQPNSTPPSGYGPPPTGGQFPSGSQQPKYGQPGLPASSQPVSSPPAASPPSSFRQPPTTQQLSQPPRQIPATTEDAYGYGRPATSAAPLNNFQSRPSAQPLSNSRPSAAARSVDAAGSSKPRAMMQAMLTAPNGSRLQGRPVTLVEVVSSASTRSDQSRRIDAYWDLCSSVADYYLGVREQQELQQLRSTVTSVGSVWQAAEAELGVRISTSQKAAVASQYRLASLMSDNGSMGLPLPADLPHCGDYYARYDQVFAGRQSGEAQQLAELLPLRYEELVDAETAVARAEEFMTAISAQRGAGDGTGQLKALELLALRRRAFVQIARDYNRRIARYTELSTPGDIGSDRLISMLIKRGSTTGGNAPNTATRPGSYAPPPNRQSQLPADDPSQTFAEGWESIKSAAAEIPADEPAGQVRQAAAEEEAKFGTEAFGAGEFGAEGSAELETETLKPEPGRERSLLVPRTP